MPRVQALLHSLFGAAGGRRTKVASAAGLGIAIICRLCSGGFLGIEIETSCSSSQPLAPPQPKCFPSLRVACAWPCFTTKACHRSSGDAPSEEAVELPSARVAKRRRWVSRIDYIHSEIRDTSEHPPPGHPPGLVITSIRGRAAKTRLILPIRAFALAGAIFEPEGMAAYCQSDSRGPDCELAEGADLAKVDLSEASKSYRDERIRASFAMAPAVGVGIRVTSLAEIAIPVHVVTTRDDELLDPDRNAMRYARNTPRAALTIREEGGHFVYPSRCFLPIKIVTYFLEFDVCGTRSPVDRDSVHREIAELAAAFFDQNLEP